MGNFTEFAESASRKFHERTCFGPLVLLTCKKERMNACGYRQRFTDYLCMFNKLIITLDNPSKFPKFSILLSYELLQKLVTPFYLYDYHKYMIYEGTTNVPFSFPHFSIIYIYLSYLYTIWVAHGQGIDIKITATTIISQTNVLVNIYDGPILVKSSTLHEVASSGFKYQAGFRMTIGLTFIDAVFQELAALSYNAYQYQRQVIQLDKYQNATRTISIDTSKRNHNQIFYYKYLTVSTVKTKFVQVTFANLTKFYKASQGCEDGGFVLSDVLQHHNFVTGPFCSQHGTEPLVNAIKTFLSTQNFITIFVYSYQFQMEVNIVFSQTLCEGITNPCSRFCNPNQELPTQNYKTKISSSDHSCYGSIYMEKGCVVVQKTPAAKIICKIEIIASAGQLKTSDFRMINNIR